MLAARVLAAGRAVRAGPVGPAVVQRVANAALSQSASDGGSQPPPQRPPPSGGNRPPKRGHDTSRFLQGLAAEAAAATRKRSTEPRSQQEKKQTPPPKPAEDLSGLSASEALVVMLERQIKEIEDGLRLDQRAFANLDLDPEAERLLGEQAFSMDEDQAFTLARLAQADALGMNLRERPRHARAHDDDRDEDGDIVPDPANKLDMGEEDGDTTGLNDSDDESSVSHPGMLDTAKLSRIASYLSKEGQDDAGDFAQPARKPKRIDLKKHYKIDINHKNLELLSNFVSDTGRIVPARQSGLAARSQRKIARMIKRARHAGLLPYMAKLPEFAPYEHIDHRGVKDEAFAADFETLRREAQEGSSSSSDSESDSDSELERPAFRNSGVDSRL